MDQTVIDEVMRWVVPAATVAGATALVIAAIVIAVRRAQRGPTARAAAEAARTSAGSALVRLDDAVNDLEIEARLSGALYGGESASSLRRARLTAQHEREDVFAEFARLVDGHAATPAAQRRLAEDIRARADRARSQVDRAREIHAEWVASHVAAAERVAAERERFDGAARERGNPDALRAELAARFAASEWADIASGVEAAEVAMAAAQAELEQAEADAGDPTRSVLEPLAAAERHLREAQAYDRRLEELHRRLTSTAAALPDEFDSAREALRYALALRATMPPDAGDRLAETVRDAQTRLTSLWPEAARRPAYTVDELARLRDGLDLAIGDARSAQQRLRGARTALPGALGAARNALARADAAVARPGVGASARVRLADARSKLADARQSTHPVEALDAARAATRLAEDAQALADFDLLDS